MCVCVRTDAVFFNVMVMPIIFRDSTPKHQHISGCFFCLFVFYIRLYSPGRIQSNHNMGALRQHPDWTQGHVLIEDKQHALLLLPLIHSTFPQAHLHVLIKAQLFPLPISEGREEEKKTSTMYDVWK